MVSYQNDLEMLGESHIEVCYRRVYPIQIPCGTGGGVIKRGWKIRHL